MKIENNWLQIVTLNICRVFLETNDKYPTRIQPKYSLALTWLMQVSLYGSD